MKPKIRNRHSSGPSALTWSFSDFQNLSQSIFINRPSFYKGVKEQYVQSFKKLETLQDLKLKIFFFSEKQRFSHEYWILSRIVYLLMKSISTLILVIWKNNRGKARSKNWEFQTQRQFDKYLWDMFSQGIYWFPCGSLSYY